MLRWLLPENIADVLPSEARRIEELRRRLLDLYRSYGYELVMPPMIEHIESLLTGSGRDLGLRTFQLVDQMSGRTLGLRADITPQVARIDAHLLNRTGVARLCYAGSVLHTRATNPFATREPIQVGAEVYGHAGLEADLEVLELIVRSLAVADCQRVRIDLCHVGVVPALLSLHGPVPGLDEEDLYALLQGKDQPGLAQATAAAPVALRDALLALPELYGRLDTAAADGGPLARARRLLPQTGPVSAALDRLERLAGSPIWQRWPGVELSVDLADLRGYRYHNGTTFAVYVDGLPLALARGGRYDDAGRVFGRGRPATGFSLDLRALASLQASQPPVSAVSAPWSDDPALADAVAGLRAAGEIVIQALPDSEQEQQEFICDRELVADGDGRWIVRPMQQEQVV
ncbi:MAG: ATP phosphoribosyltransferase regulatory subunit [Burkholderiaceae bacterium]